MEILKTDKMYVGGEFIRSESGRTEAFFSPAKIEIARVNIASKKDFRNAIEKAKSGVSSWASKTAYNRSQIIYRMAEMAQARFDEFEKNLIESCQYSQDEAKNEVQAMI